MVFGLAALLNACTYKFTLNDRDLAHGKVVAIDRSLYFWGWAGNNVIKVYEVCKSNRLAALRDEQSGWQMLGTVLSLGIIQPRTITLACENPGVQAIPW